MSDYPLQTVLQQRDARPVSGEHLEVLGKKAASDWVTGKIASLHEAVVNAVRDEHLSPEQVRRVVEFTNSDAYLQEFRKESSQHRVVHFDCGPADPAQVLQDLNDGGGGSRYDDGSLDYQRSPRSVKEAAQAASMDKTAAAGDEPAAAGLPKLPKMPALPKQASAYEGHLWAAFGGGKDVPLTPHEPLRPLMDVKDKLAGAHAQVSSELDQVEVDYATVGDALYHQVKQAALEGTSLSDVVASFSAITTDPVYVKVAFQLFTPRFRREQVFPSYEAIGESLAKTAASHDVNPDHPLVTAFGDFVGVLNKLAGLRALQAEFAQGVDQADALMKQAASGGILGAAKRGLSAASEGIDAASPAIARVLVGAQDAGHVAPTLAKGLKAGGLVTGALVGNAALQQVTDQPIVSNTLSAAKSVVPGTAEYQMRRYRNMTGQ